ncbi:MAG: hypothetical protein CL570_04015 [Alphaproteobacteria bacterium]|nr:hypothetical protein [Alphaproteobacteria bacterium]HCQ71397.1 hypothetical protein [Rhodospirillaceae bacterium]|tara:strand:- start:58357 stop:58722 length:366 start_codon:yes stop_codon:yes gene_type:complete
MKLLISLCFACVCLSATAVSAQSASQCTTSELDLVCASGQFLRGINPDGTKICEAAPAAGITECKYCYNFTKMTPAAANQNSNTTVRETKCTGWIGAGDSERVEYDHSSGTRYNYVTVTCR